MATQSFGRRRPEPGDVLPYGFLWSHEFEAGRDDPAKERPCVVVLAVGEGEHPEVMVAPITSREPGRRDAIQLGAGAVGVDRGSWIIHWELNVFVWPGPDVGAAAAPAGAWWRIGALAPSLRVRLADLIRDGLRARAVSITRRTE